MTQSFQRPGGLSVLETFLFGLGTTQKSYFRESDVVKASKSLRSWPMTSHHSILVRLSFTKSCSRQLFKLVGFAVIGSFNFWWHGRDTMNKVWLKFTIQICFKKSRGESSYRMQKLRPWVISDNTRNYARTFIMHFCVPTAAGQR